MWNLLRRLSTRGRFSGEPILEILPASCSVTDKPCDGPRPPTCPSTKHVGQSRPKTTCYPLQGPLASAARLFHPHLLLASIHRTGAPGGSYAHKLISLSHPFAIEARLLSNTKSSQLLLDNGWALVEMGVLARSASNYHFLPFRRPPPRLDWPPAGERGSPSADRSSLLVGLLPSPATGCITHLVININNILIIIIICITFCTVVVSHPMPCNLHNLPKQL